MNIPFLKYHGTGNDFVLIDQRSHQYLTRRDQTTISGICRRHFGVGADGLILLQDHTEVDFEMIYFNADGNESSMCGNGGRCIVAFAYHLGIFEQQCIFKAIDGLHEAKYNKDQVELKMQNVQLLERFDDYFFLDTGSPHYVSFPTHFDEVDVVKEGSAIRYSKSFQPNGTNVNFVRIHPNGIEVATYERGVEDETLSCGTGVTAAALSYATTLPQAITSVNVKTKGGMLTVKFEQKENEFSQIWLCGSAMKVFEGIITV